MFVGWRWTSPTSSGRRSRNWFQGLSGSGRPRRVAGRGGTRVTFCTEFSGSYGPALRGQTFRRGTRRTPLAIAVSRNGKAKGYSIASSERLRETCTSAARST
jgi:hypothetical protein